MEDNCSVVLGHETSTEEGATPAFISYRTRLTASYRAWTQSKFTIEMIQTTPDECKAVVVPEDECSALRQPHRVDVRFGTGFSFEEFKRRNDEWQQGHMHLFSRGRVPSLLYIGKGGLQGSGNAWCAMSLQNFCEKCDEKAWKCICGYTCPDNLCWSHCVNELHYNSHICKSCSNDSTKCPRHFKCKTCSSNEKCSKCCGCLEKAQQLENIRKEEERNRKEESQQKKEQFRQEVINMLISDICDPESGSKAKWSEKSRKPKYGKIAGHLESPSTSFKRNVESERTSTMPCKIRNAYKTPPDEVIKSKRINLKSTLDRMMQDYAQNKTINDPHIYKFAIIPNIMDELESAESSTIESLERYVSEGNVIDFDAVIALPISDWVIAFLKNEILSSLYSENSEPNLKRFVGLVEKFKNNHKDRYDAESSMYKLRDDQIEHQFPLSVMNDMLESYCFCLL